MIIYSTLFLFNNNSQFCHIGQRANKVTPKKWRLLWRLRQRALRTDPHQSYAEGFENVRRVGHNSRPLVAYYANNCPWQLLAPHRPEREAGKRNPRE